ncbi:hypothetical protein NBRC111894_1565 [Sporolactobacillus inulinus]|uniref:Uncharacterized protein n=1 Tax=Sporolactobacillus inulinus TaxID=2078 RepID=A0A4Y1ZAR0_9BACL|nr:hypothetical protein NBRC111894_1565 [Sporolactobacillus inulinus]
MTLHLELCRCSCVIGGNKNLLRRLSGTPFIAAEGAIEMDASFSKANS